MSDQQKEPAGTRMVVLMAILSLLLPLAAGE